MIEKYIEHWSRIISESCGEKRDEIVSEERIGISRDNELTRQINGIVSPDLFARKDGETKDLYKADFRVNTSDSGTLFHVFGKKVEGIPNEKIFIYFMCLKGKVTLKRMCDYVNSMCSDILPQKFEPSLFMKISPVQQRGGREMDLYLYQVGTYSRTERYIRENFLVTNGRFRQAGLMYKHGDYEYLSKIFAKYPKILENLDRGSKYLVLLYIKDTLTKPSVVRIFNGLNNSQNNAMLFKKDITEDDVIDLGTLKLRHKQSGLMVNLVACAVKTEK